MKIKPELIHVIVSGFPDPLASKVATACKNRGFSLAKWGLSTKDTNPDGLDIPKVGKLRLVSLTNKQEAKSQIQTEADEVKRENRFPVVADVSKDSSNVELFNSCNIPFVLQTADHESKTKLIDQSKQLSVIADDFNKHFVAFDTIMRDWGRRFPGLFRGFEIVGDGKTASRHLIHSFNDLFDVNFKAETLNGGNKKDLNFLEGRSSQEFSFKNGNGSTMFTFRRSATPEDFAEGVADSIQFLAEQSQSNRPPRTYSMLDVARQLSML